MSLAYFLPKPIKKVEAASLLLAKCIILLKEAKFGNIRNQTTLTAKSHCLKFFYSKPNHLQSVPYLLFYSYSDGLWQCSLRHSPHTSSPTGQERVGLGSIYHELCSIRAEVAGPSSPVLESNQVNITKGRKRIGKDSLPLDLITLVTSAIQSLLLFENSGWAGAAFSSL